MRKRSVFRPVYMTLVLVLLYLPILMVVIFSFNPSKNAGVMTGFTLDWYARLFRNASLGHALVNSLTVAGWSCAMAAVIGTLGAVGMARARLRMLGALDVLTSLPIMLPEIVLGIAYMVFFSSVSASLGIRTLIIGHTTFCIPYIFIIVRGRLVGLDPQLAEAARDLGASPRRVFVDITLPLVMPAVISGMLLALAMSLDDVIISFFISGPDSSTLPLKIYSSLKAGVSPEINALCTIMLGVVFIAVAISQLIKGRQIHNAQRPNPPHTDFIQ